MDDEGSLSFPEGEFPESLYIRSGGPLTRSDFKSRVLDIVCLRLGKVNKDGHGGVLRCSLVKRCLVVNIWERVFCVILRVTHSLSVNIRTPIMPFHNLRLSRCPDVRCPALHRCTV